MHRMRFQLPLLLALLAPFSFAAPQSLDGALRMDYAARQELLNRASLAEFEALAAECQRARLYADSDRMHFLVLHIDPDNRASRRGLRFRHGRSDEWLQVPGWKPRTNRNPNPSLELVKRVERALTDYRTKSLAIIEKQRLELRLRGVERERAALVVLMPDDSVVRAAAGEVQVPEGWMLVESAAAIKHRSAFPQLARACMTLSEEPVEGEIRPEELETRLPWNAARKTPHVRVVATTGLEEAQATSRASHAVGNYFRMVFAVDGRPREDFTIYLLTLNLKQMLLARWPDLSEETRRALLKADGGWLDSSTRLAEWSANPARRLDGAVRQTLGTLLIDTYQITGRHGWAWEGIGLYMVHDLLGTRLTWFFDASGGATQQVTGLWSMLQSPEVSWTDVARERIERAPSAFLATLLEKNVNAMSEEDVLISYALASYLMEGFPSATPRILRRIGAGDNARHVFETELGYSLPALERRLLRWLKETAVLR